MFRRGGALSADLVAVTTALAGAGVLLGVPVLAAEGVLVVLLGLGVAMLAAAVVAVIPHVGRPGHETGALRLGGLDRKSTRLNSSHVAISYAVFCLQKKRP